ncbi:MAG: TetR/AcrR family transcriptional regulator [Paludibacteraceae bacterium]|nr:TetR/AcrR family transcriptional regulator [Paludibacteraceae bacterium]
MKPDRKEEIAIKALELFALNGYDSTSISDLQYALDMGRGTLYYYFRDKDELFTEVMNRFFLTPKQQRLNTLIEQTVTIPEMIQALLSYLYSLQDLLTQFENKHVNTSNVVTLMNTAYHRYPELYRKARRIYEKELYLWKRALQHEMQQGIIRRDIPVDTMAMMFTHLKDGFDTAKAGVTMDFTAFPQQYNYLYDLLKVKE